MAVGTEGEMWDNNKCLRDLVQDPQFISPRWNLSPKKNNKVLPNVFILHVTLWTDIFAQQTHHYSFANEKSSYDNNKRHQGEKNHTEWLGTLEKGGKTEL